MRNIRQNLFFAFIYYNALSVPVAAGALYPFFGILLSPAITALAMSLSSVSAMKTAIADPGRHHVRRVFIHRGARGRAGRTVVGNALRLCSVRL